MNFITSYNALPKQTKIVMFISAVAGVIIGKLFSSYVGGFIDGFFLG